MEGLVEKYTAGSKYGQKQSANRIAEFKKNALAQEEMRLQKELAMAKQDIDNINKEVEDNIRANQVN